MEFEYEQSEARQEHYTKEMTESSSASPATNQRRDDIVVRVGVYHLIYASEGRNQGISLGEVRVETASDGVSFSSQCESPRICGHVSALACFVCVFDEDGSCRPRIIHSVPATSGRNTEEFELKLLAPLFSSERCGFLLFRKA